MGITLATKWTMQFKLKLLLAGLGCLIVSQSLAQQPNVIGGLPNSSSSIRPTVDFTVTQRPFVTDGTLEFEMTFAYSPTIAATKAPQEEQATTLTLLEVTVCPPPEIVAIWPGTSCHYRILQLNKQVYLGDAIIERMTINKPIDAASAAASFELYKTLSYAFHFLTFEPNDYNFLVRTSYLIGGSQQRRIVDQRVTVTMRPPLFVMIVGACVGALLLAGFIFTFKLWKEQGLSSRAVLQVAGRSIGIFFIGSITACIFVFLTFRLKSEALPISLTVNDFYGGIVIGLFTFKLSDWLYEKLEIH